jgi:hypothetical protein
MSAIRLLGPACLLLILAGLAYLAWHFSASNRPDANPGASLAASANVQEASAEQVHQFCGACHAYPPADTFPRYAWRKEVKQGYDFFHDSGLSLDYPALDSVVAYYERRAPEKLPAIEPARHSVKPPVEFERRGYRFPNQVQSPAVSHVNLVHLYDRQKLDILVCDMRCNQVLTLRPYTNPPEWQVLAKVPVPAHAEVVDLDGDGIPDLLVACLGTFQTSDARVGSVVWLRGSRDGTYQPITLLDGIGRVADVHAADFRGNGQLDLVVAEFGKHRTGGVLYLENRTTDWSRPNFVPQVLDERAGAIHVPVADLNRDGRPDFVALISQEHETVVAFLNEGHGHFRKEVIYSAPHPAFGSSGIQLVDLDGDGSLDVLLTNGDIFDPPYLLKPYHGIQWLRNQGRFPFVPHRVAAMYGVERALAVDLEGTGRLSIVAVSCLPAEAFPQRREQGLASVLLLQQTRPNEYAQHVLETGTCDHFACAAGPWNGDGKMHLVTGNFSLTDSQPQLDAVVLWTSRTAKGSGASHD